MFLTFAVTTASAETFQDVLDDHWQRSIEEQVFFRGDPDAYRMHGKLAEVDTEARRRRRDFNEQILERLKDVDSRTLNTKDKVSYQVFRYERLTERESYSQFDHLFSDGEDFEVGRMAAKALHTPGHTPACVTYVFGDAAFVGDTIFMPDFGTARTDFPGGDAAMLYRSLKRILSLPPQTRLFMCHDYGPAGRDFAWESTVAEERANNIHIHDGVGEDEFVKMRTERDNAIDLPRLILPSVQVNIRAGRLPPAEDNGVSYLKVPLNAL